MTTGQIVGTPGSVLCGLNPPVTAFSDPILGYDTTSNQRAFGTATGGNSNVPCTGNFGDTKGLDLWTYYTTTPTSGTLGVVANVTPTVPLTVPLTTPGTPNTGSELLTQVTAGLLLALMGTLLAVTAAGRRMSICPRRGGKRSADK
jgi:hypothetical protein